MEAKYVDCDVLATNKTSVEVKKPELSIPKIKVKKKRKTLNIYWGIIPDSSKGIEIYMKEGKNKKYKKVNTTTNLKKNKNNTTSYINTMELGKQRIELLKEYKIIK